MTLIQIARINAEGRAAVRSLLEMTSKVSDPSERREAAHSIMLNPAFVEVIPAAGLIDLDERFATAYDYASYIHPRIAPLGESALLDTGINLFLLLAHIDQHVAANAKVIDNYFVEERTNGGKGSKRNYRNAIHVHLSLYRYHRDNEAVCRTLLAGLPSAITMAEDRIAQRTAIMVSPGAIELIIAMFFDPATGKNRRTPPTTKGSKFPNKNVNDGLKELSVIVFGQCARNYDVARMSAKQILALVPDTKGLLPYKKYAKKWFAARALEETSALTA